MNFLSPSDSRIPHFKGPRVELGHDAQNSKAAHEYTWSYSSEYSLHVAAFTFQRHLRKVSSDWFELQAQQMEFESEFEEKTLFLSDASVALVIEGKIYHYSISQELQRQRLTSNQKVDALVETLNQQVRDNNPLRRKHLQLVNGYEGFKAYPKKVPSVTFDSLILDRRMVDDIYDNTIFHLKHIDGNNGVILHGNPGTGKSLMCQAIVHEAIREGFSTCFVVGQVDFTSLAKFLDTFLIPCIIFFEDVDSFAKQRDHGSDNGIADFLQFLSGLAERNGKMVVVATTNHLDVLDKAIQNRPVRFNRRYEFKLPTNEQLDQLVEMYFSGDSIPSESRRICHDQQFTGAHIAEVRRTAMLIAKKQSKPMGAVFTEAVEIVRQTFSPTLKAIGFSKHK